MADVQACETFKISHVFGGKSKKLHCNAVKYLKYLTSHLRTLLRPNPAPCRALTFSVSCESRSETQQIAGWVTDAFHHYFIKSDSCGLVFFFRERFTILTGRWQTDKYKNYILNKIKYVLNSEYSNKNVLYKVVGGKKKSITQL